MSCWGWPCQPFVTLSCCYVSVKTENWRFYRFEDLNIPPEWMWKVERFRKMFFRDDTELGYIVVRDRHDKICTILAVVIYSNHRDRIVTDFIDIDEWLRFFDHDP